MNTNENRALLNEDLRVPGSRTRHIFINIGMVLGIMPVVGIPLPLLSYGGSFLLSTLIGVGLLLNVSMRRYLF